MPFDVRQTFAAIIALDVTAYKAAGATDETLTNRVEERLHKALTTTFIRRARRGVERAKELALHSGLEVDENELESILKAVSESFDGWDREAEPLLATSVEECYRIGKNGAYSSYSRSRKVQKADAKPPKKAGGPPKGAKVLEIKPKFDLVDDAAMEALTKHQVFWIAGAYDSALSGKIAAIAKDVLIDSGLSTADAAHAFEVALAKEFGYDPKAPFSSYSKPPLPMGWRGDAISYLEGLASNAATVARVTGSVRAYNELGVTHYEIVNASDERTCKRCSTLNGRTFEVKHAARRVEVTTNLATTPDQIKELHPWPSEKDMEKVIPAEAKKDDAKINAQIAKLNWGLPPFHYKCRCTVDIAETTEFVPEEIAPESPPPGGFPWREGQLTKVNKSLAGMHEKVVFTDPNGDEWIFKPTHDEFRALGDKAAADLAKLMGRETAEIYTTTIGGRFGSIQKVFKGVIGDLSGLLPEALSAAEIVALQKEHIFDWLISQHDTHRENVLNTGDGLKFIDKGQLFRFFGKDKLHYSYGGNGEPNPVESYYHRMFKDYAAGRPVKLSALKDLEAAFKQMSDVPDAEMVRILRPYASAAMKAAAGNPGMKAAAWMGRYTEEEFLASVLARKNALMGDLKRFYEELEAARAASLGPVAPDRKKELKKALAGARKSGWVGNSVFVKGADFEDMNLLLYGTEGDGTFLESKLRPSADRKLRALIGLKPEAASTPADPYFNDVLKVTKSFNYHLKDGGSGKVPEHNAALAKELQYKLEVAAKAKGDKAAQHYLDHLESIWDTKMGGWKKEGLGKQLAQAKFPTPKAPKSGLPEGWNVQLTKHGDPIGRKLKDGKIVFDPKEHQPTYLDRVSADSYKLTSPDGNVEVYYRPHDGQGVAGQGQFKVWMKKPISELTEKEIDAAMESLGKLGLENQLATKKDMELMYLRKLSFKHKWDQATDSIPDDLDVDEQITRLKGYMKEKGVTFGKEYKPEPTFDRADKTGWARWMDHTIDDKEIKNLRLTHSSSAGIDTSLDLMLAGKTNALVPTLERMRIGIPTSGGMSPEADLQSGGASYVFTRVASNATKVRGYVFKQELLKDMTAVSHDQDRYGRFADRNFRVPPEKWKELPSRSDNETIFKHDLPLDYLDRIQVGSESERARVLDVFRKHGYKEFAGKAIEDLVKVK